MSPRDVLEAVGVEAGDLLEAKAEAGKITLTPRAAVSAGIAESIADFAAGHSFGPLANSEELVKSLDEKRAKLRAKAPGKRKPRR